MGPILRVHNETREDFGVGVQQFSHSAGGQLLFPCTLGTIGWVTGRSFVI